METKKIPTTITKPSLILSLAELESIDRRFWEDFFFLRSYGEDTPNATRYRKARKIMQEAVSEVSARRIALELEDL